MQIVETSIFTRQVTKLLSDDEYRLLQEALTLHPTMGAVIVGTGGARKVRWATPGSGKSGGVRVIYYFAAGKAILLMLTTYRKNEQDTLTDAQKEALRKVIQASS